ncbi:MAG: hypothetical protein EOO12_06320 [Chitinophagaceae bacterium]|nr:MAG: hypothetical protein EOO12_06320 [Chitinophagaceae bacterium]
MKLVNLIAAFLVAAFLIFLPIKYYVIDANKLDTNYRYTVGEVYSISYPADGGPDAKFRYCVKNAEYKSSIVIDPYERELSVGDTILVKYYVPDPTLVRGQYQNPVDQAEYGKFDSSRCGSR